MLFVYRSQKAFPDKGRPRREAGHAKPRIRKLLTAGLPKEKNSQTRALREALIPRSRRVTMSRTSAYNIQPRLRLKFSVSLIQALAAWSILALSQPCNGQTIVPYTQDPAGYAIGFARGHWANSVSKMV